jgi:hypothetical protein
MKIVYIPDTQVKPGTPTDHILAAGNYIVKHRPNVVVVGGDWWDMESLSSFNSSREAEGKRVLKDLMAGNDAMELFMKPLLKLQRKQKKDKKRVYKPRLVFTVGNHDPQVRLPRYLETNPLMAGMIEERSTTNLLKSYGFEVYDFLDVVNIEGIRFSHYFQNPHSAKKSPISGAIDTCLKNVGFSFVQGHQQGLKVGKHYLGDGTCRVGIIAGSFYQHEEKYMGEQGNNHWQGIIQLNDVKEGGADICELSLDYLKRKYL